MVVIDLLVWWVNVSNLKIKTKNGSSLSMEINPAETTISLDGEPYVLMPVENGEKISSEKEANEKEIHYMMGGRK